MTDEVKRFWPGARVKVTWPGMLPWHGNVIESAMPKTGPREALVQDDHGKRYVVNYIHAKAI